MTSTAIAMTDPELERLRAEVKEAAALRIYNRTEGHEERERHFQELNGRLLAEEVRRASLSGFNLVEQQLRIERDNLEANRRMAEATEAAAVASAEAARAAKHAAIWTAAAAIVTAIGTALAWLGSHR
jgi:hypothetical protein